jgi:hypothetical protein
MRRRVCSECSRDISDLRVDADVCRRSKCRKAAQRSCERNGHRVETGQCDRCNRFILMPRSRWRVRRSRLDGLPVLRTRLASDPPPPAAPRRSDFLRDDGRELYADARECTPEERAWLNRVAPDPDWTPRPYFERVHSPDMQPACRSGRTGSPEQDISHYPGPPDEDIYTLAVGGGDGDLTTGTGATASSQSFGDPNRVWLDPPEGLVRWRHWRNRGVVKVLPVPRGDDLTDELGIAA